MSEAKVEEITSKMEEAPKVTMEDAVKEESKDESKPADVIKSEDIKSEVASPESKKKPYSKTYEEGDLVGVLKTSAKEHDDIKKNVKYDPSILPESKDPVQIRNQVEFYFNNSNLRQDKFLLEKTGGAANSPVPLATILMFKRMKRFTSREAVVAALRDSRTLNLTGDEGNEQLTRKVPYDPLVAEDSDRIDARSIYVKGFGDEADDTQFEVEAFFKPYEGVEAVRLRRTPQKLFKGSVFVEFESAENAQAFLALEPKPLWKGEHILKVTSKKEYCDQKLQDIRDGKIEPGESYNPGRGRGRGRGRGGRGGRGGGDRDNRDKRDNRDRGDRRDRGERSDRGDRDPDDWKKRREDDRANGFKDGRGRGRGGRGGRRDRDDRGPRNNDRNKERSEENGTKDGAADAKPKVEENAKESVNTEATSTETNDKKRGREDDASEAPPAKKVDVKTEA